MAVTKLAILILASVALSTPETLETCPAGYTFHEVTYDTVIKDGIFTFKIIDTKKGSSKNELAAHSALDGSGDFLILLGREKFSFHLKGQMFYFKKLCVEVLGAMKLTVDLADINSMKINPDNALGKDIPKKYRQQFRQACIESAEELGKATTKGELRFKATPGTAFEELQANEVPFQNLKVYTCIKKT